MKRALVMQATLAMAFVLRNAYALPTANVLVSGQTTMLFVDVNGNGPDSGDCLFTATVSPPSLTFTSFSSSSTQPSNTMTQIRGCGGTASGSVYVNNDSSSDFIDVTINMVSNPAPSGMAWPLTGLFHAPVFVDAFEEFPPGQTPNGLPIAINTIDVSTPDHGTNTADRAHMQLCSANGPAVLVSAGGTTFLIQASLYPNAQNPTHLKIPSLPLEKVGGGIALVDAYIPLSNRAITVSYDNDPSTLLVDLGLDSLAVCSRSSAPTLTERGFIGVLLALLVLGVWRLRRRPEFALLSSLSEN